MKWIFSHKFAIFVALVLIVGALWSLRSVLSHKEQNFLSATVTQGDVTTVVSVSGFVEAKNTAELAFPTTGIVTDVFVAEGDVVSADEVLATLGSAELAADRNEAAASLRAAQARYDEALAGPRAESIEVAETNVRNAELALERVQRESAEAVLNARRDLLSNDLETLSDDPDEDATAPTVSGTYACEDEGAYAVSVYQSGARSGFSFDVSGLENYGGGTANTGQPVPFGDCGLFLQFAPGVDYARTDWTIAIPNKKSSTYITKQNTLDAALTAQTNQIAAAEDTLALALEEAALTSAGARNETLRANAAAVDEVRARIARIDALLADRSITAPFPGTVTSVDVLPGETAGTQSVITLLSDDAFELKARIPEIDIRKNEVGQVVLAAFDASPDEVQAGTITYLSPLATEIDGVAYFEATVTLDETPTWLRSGLNADIDITIATEENALRLPQRFVTTNEAGEDSVWILEGRKPVQQAVTIIANGNDGYVALAGLTLGTVVVLPE